MIGRIKNARGEPVMIDESSVFWEPDLPSKLELSPPTKGNIPVLFV